MRRLITLMATLLVASLAPALTSSAQASWEQCEQGRLCGWHNTAYTGTYNRYTNDFNDLGSNSDEWDSIRNYDDVAWLVFKDKDYKGTVKCIRPGKGTRDLGSYGLHDAISSIKKRTVTGCSDYAQIG
jgi:hypothetical protein